LEARTRYAADSDFVFPSLKARGRIPVFSSGLVADHLSPAAKAAGVKIADGQRFSLHNLSHSLSKYLVNTAKVQAKSSAQHGFSAKSKGLWDWVSL